MLALGLAAIVGSSACHRPGGHGSDEADAGSLDPDALVAEAEELRLAYEKGASERAILKYQDARDAWMRDSDGARAAKASQMLGAAHEQLGFLDEALRGYLEAAELCRDSCDSLLESSIRSDIGLIQATLADSGEFLAAALEQCQRALSLSSPAGGLREVAQALTCAGEVEYNRGNLEKALALYRQAKRAWERAADPRGLAETLFYEGTVRIEPVR